MGQKRSAALGLLVLLIAGCGGGGGDQASTAATAAPSAVEVFVDKPDNGETVKAKRAVGDRLKGNVTVNGTTGAGAVVVVQATCDQETDCRTSITAGEDGAFEQEVEVWSTVGRDQGRLIIGLQGSPPVDRERLVLLLEAKEPKPEPTPKPKKKKGERGGGGDEIAPVPVPVPPEALPDLPEVPPAPLPIPEGPTGGGVAGPVVMIGDSLAEGTEPLFGPLLGTSVTTDARRGRPLAEGMSVLNRMTLPDGPKTLAFSLFTNDSPSNVPALESAVRTSVARAGKGGCAIWATISRPAVRGVSYGAANARLNQLGAELGRLRVVPWAETVAADPGLLGRDRVHGTAAGYRKRAELYAQAAASC
ncbi:MAG: hypothetical protein ABW081_01645 [Solirubrobacteraceae bacterium]